MGRKLILTGTKLTDLAAPRLVNIDPIESAGSLLLIDPTHPAGAWAAGVPANGSAIPNLFADNARAVTGSSATMDLQALVGTGWDNTKGKLERTAKGGLHGIVSTTLADMNTRYFAYVPDALKTHLLNSGHLFYFSTWARITRASNGGSGMFQNHSSNASASSNYLAVLRPGENKPSTGRIAANGVGAALANLSSAAWTGTKPTGLGTFISLVNILGADGTYNYTDTLARGSGSRVIYRTYIEDLTVSGRTYAQADALDLAEYTKHVLTAGGRYHADTYTDPATLA